MRAPLILERLGELYPEATCSLDWRTPYELLVATMLSAQCTDERVNKVTPALFARFPDAAAAAAVEPAEVEPYVQSTGFFRNKAKAIVGSSRLLMEHHGGEVPRTMEELLVLPGVARKTASVVLAWCFGINAGVTVDTHVSRLAQRLKLSRHSEPRPQRQAAGVGVQLDAVLMDRHGGAAGRHSRFERGQGREPRP